MLDESSFNFSLSPVLEICMSRSKVLICMAPFISYILLFPLFIFVLYVGYQQWKNQRSVAAAATMSHSDIFTFNMVALEMIGVVGSSVYCYALYARHRNVVMVGLDSYKMVLLGQLLFHSLTCADRYLAIVHPITYVGLRQARGVRMRNIGIGCVWLLSLGSLGLSRVSSVVPIVFYLLLLVPNLVVIPFCSLSILCVLTRPGPGAVRGNRERVDQSKQRAFYAVVAIMGALLVRLLITPVSILAVILPELWGHIDINLLGLFTNWSFQPSSLVLPLLFLHRSGKLPGCKRNTEQQK